MENTIPVKFWGLDSLYWSHLKLFVRDVLQLYNYPGFKGIYAIGNHPVVNVMIVGYVVEVDKKEKLISYGVDDGTGLISCCFWYHQNSNIIEASFGDLVTALGKITVFRDERQLTLSSLHIEADHNVEVLHWLEVMKLRKTYLKPFELANKHNTLYNQQKLPWCTDSLDAEIFDLKDSLKHEISESLELTGTLHFTMDMLCSNESIMKVVKKLVFKYRQRTPSSERNNLAELTKREVMQTLKDCLGKLEKLGIVFSKPENNCNSRNYEFISIKKDLVPRVAIIIKEISEREGESSNGISLSKIMHSLRTLEKYKNVQRDRVNKTLENLVNTGDIYETNQDYYRVT